MNDLIKAKIIELVDKAKGLLAEAEDLADNNSVYLRYTIDCDLYDDDWDESFESSSCYEEDDDWQSSEVC